jgi:hypothetical protein
MECVCEGLVVCSNHRKSISKAMRQEGDGCLCFSKACETVSLAVFGEQDERVPSALKEDPKFIVVGDMITGAVEWIVKRVCSRRFPPRAIEYARIYELVHPPMTREAFGRRLKEFKRAIAAHKCPAVMELSKTTIRRSTRHNCYSETKLHSALVNRDYQGIPLEELAVEVTALSLSSPAAACLSPSANHVCRCRMNTSGSTFEISKKGTAWS